MKENQTYTSLLVSVICPCFPLHLLCNSRFLLHSSSSPSATNPQPCPPNSPLFPTSILTVESHQAAAAPATPLAPAASGRLATRCSINTHAQHPAPVHTRVNTASNRPPRWTPPGPKEPHSRDLWPLLVLWESVANSGRDVSV